MRAALVVVAVSAACGADDAREADEPGSADGGGNSCSCLVGGFDAETDEAVVAMIDADSLRVEQAIVPVHERPRVIATDAAQLVVEPTAGVVHVRDFSPARSTIEIGQGARVVAYMSSLGSGGGTHQAPVYVALEAEPVVRRYVRGEETAPAAAGEPAASADLAGYDDDGDPDVFAMWAQREAVVVVMERRDSKAPGEGRPLVALLDPTTLEEVDTFEARGGQPTVLQEDLLATRDGDEPGCLQRLVLDDGAPRAECVLDNEALGGVVVAIDGTWPWRAWATIEDGAGDTRVARLELGEDGPSVGETVSRSAHSPAAVADCGKWVVYADAEAGGVHVFDWTHDLWFTEPDGVSIGAPAVLSDAFACELAL